VNAAGTASRPSTVTSDHAGTAPVVIHGTTYSAVNGPKPTASPHSIHRSWLRCSAEEVRANARAIDQPAPRTAIARKAASSRWNLATAATGSAER
jgi:hypothetical protein